MPVFNETPTTNFPTSHDVYLKWKKRKKTLRCFCEKRMKNKHTRRGCWEWKGVKRFPRVRCSNFRLFARLQHLRSSICRECHRNLQVNWLRTSATNRPMIHIISLSSVISTETLNLLWLCRLTTDRVSKVLSFIKIVFDLCTDKTVNVPCENKEWWAFILVSKNFHDVTGHVNIFLFAQKWEITSKFLLSFPRKKTSPTLTN